MLKKLLLSTLIATPVLAAHAGNIIRIPTIGIHLPATPPTGGGGTGTGGGTDPNPPVTAPDNFALSSSLSTMSLTAQAGHPATQTTTVTNSGNRAVTLNNVSALGLETVTVSGDCSGAVLQPQDSCDVTLTHNGVVAMSAAGNLIIGSAKATVELPVALQVTADLSTARVSDVQPEVTRPVVNSTMQGTATAMDAYGNPLVGMPISWIIGSSNGLSQTAGSLNSGTVTNSQGVATVNWVIPPKNGVYMLWAKPSPSGTTYSEMSGYETPPADSTRAEVRINPMGDVAKMVVDRFNLSSSPFATRNKPVNFSVYTNDTAGNAVPGQTITYSASKGQFSSATAVTGDYGAATGTWMAPNELGQFPLTVTAPNGTSATVVVNVVY